MSSATETALASGQGSPAVIEVHGLTKRFGRKTVVDGLDMVVRSGQIYGFLGPNGSGKTTSIRMLCGLLTPDAGEGRCLGLDLRRDGWAIKRQIGYMTQRFSWYEDLSVAENLDFAARLYGIARRRAVVEETLQRLGLAARRQQLAGTLSGGWKQRLALAACMMHQPRLLLLDEPTAGVDPAARRDFWAQIHALAADGVTVLVSTHYMDEAERCHRLAYLAWGRLLVEGTPEQVLRRVALQTFVVQGAGVAEAQALQALPSVLQVVPFGNELRVSGHADSALAQQLGQWCAAAGLTLAASQPRLEDAFIHLMQQARPAESAAPAT